MNSRQLLLCVLCLFPSVAALASTPASRIPVAFPPLVKEHTLASMRLHLEGLGKIQAELAQQNFTGAAATARYFLGMNSPLNAPNMRDEVRFMPPEMKRLGAKMHHAAERFAEAADNADVTGDMPAVLRSLSRLTQTCVACHAAYRLK